MGDELTPEEATQLRSELASIFLRDDSRRDLSDLMNRLMSDPSALREPQTLMRLVETMLSNALRDDVDFEKLTSLVERLQRLPKPKPKPRFPTLLDGNGVDLVRFLEVTRGAIGRRRELIQEWDANQPMNVLADVLARYTLGSEEEKQKGISFESSSRRRIEFVNQVSEALYKNDLAVLLQLTRLHRGRATEVPNTLGAVMGECRDAWQTEGPLWAIDDRLRLVRNSEAHFATEFDISAESITFVNKRPNGRQEHLSMTFAELDEFVNTFAHLELTLYEGLQNELAALARMK